MSTNHAYAACSFIGLLLVCIPLPWHIAARNIGTCLFMAWTAAALLIGFVNSILWDQNAFDSAPTWCDITTRIILAAGVALPTAALCIMRRMYHIATSRMVTTDSEKRRAIIVDLFIGLGIPLVQIILYYVIQGARYDVFEDFGCNAVIINTPMSVALSSSWPLVIGVISGVYGYMTIRTVARRRAEFSECVSANHHLSDHLYLRLMALGAADILVVVPLSAYFLYVDLAVIPMGSFDFGGGHSSFSVETYPAILWHSNAAVATSIELSRWIFFIASVVFFAFFGFTRDVLRPYQHLLGMDVERHSTSVPGSTGTVIYVERTVQKERSHVSLKNAISVRSDVESKDTSLPPFQFGPNSTYLDSMPNLPSQAVTVTRLKDTYRYQPTDIV